MSKTNKNKLIRVLSNPVFKYAIKHIPENNFNVQFYEINKIPTGTKAVKKNRDGKNNNI